MGVNYPELTMGQKPDGTPLVLKARFKGSVEISARQIYVEWERYCYDVEEAKERAEGLQDAIRWIEDDLNTAVEKYYQDRVQDGAASLAEDQIEPPPPEERWGVATNGHRVIWNPEMPQHRNSRNWCSALDDSLRFDSFSAVELTGSASIGVTKGSVDQVIKFVSPGVYDVEVNHDGPQHRLQIKVRLTKNQAIGFGEGAVVFRHDMSAEDQPDEYYLMTSANWFGAMWKAAGKHEFSGAHLARVWHP